MSLLYIFWSTYEAPWKFQDENCEIMKSAGTRMTSLFTLRIFHNYYDFHVIWNLHQRQTKPRNAENRSDNGDYARSALYTRRSARAAAPRPRYVSRMFRMIRMCVCENARFGQSRASPSPSTVPTIRVATSCHHL